MGGGVLEPAVVKEQANKSGIEVASMILRIDDVIATKSVGPESGEGGPLGGGMDEDVYI